MVTVDLAGLCTMERLFPGAEITLYTWGRMSTFGYAAHELPFSYKDIHEHFSEYLAADIRIVWGDFTQAAVLWKPNTSVLGPNGHSLSPQEVARIVFLTEESDDTLSRTFAFGGSLITNEALDYIDPIYAGAFERFFSRCGAVFLRDALSAAKVAPFQSGRATLGIDCALLLQNEDLRRLSHFGVASARRGVGVFFGRSPGRQQLLTFARQLARAMEVAPRWIPWFWSNKSMRALGSVNGFAIPNGFGAPGALLSQLAGCEFVVTDTYHLCVNAWRMGIPAVCVGVGAGNALDSLSDKKKEILYEMYEARRFYVFAEDLSFLGVNHRALRRVSQALSDNRVVDLVLQRVTSHASVSSARLQAAIYESFRQTSEPAKLAAVAASSAPQLPSNANA